MRLLRCFMYSFPVDDDVMTYLQNDTDDLIAVKKYMRRKKHPYISLRNDFLHLSLSVFLSFCLSLYMSLFLSLSICLCLCLSHS